MNIFVGNIPFASTDEHLAELFAAFGEVSDACILKDRETGHSRGFGFVNMPNAAEAREAIASLNEALWMGRELRVSEARPKARRTKQEAGK